MAPYDLQSPDADAILRSSDGKDLRVHKVILSLSSPVFRDMFSLPQPTESAPSHIPVVDVPESSNVLTPFIQFLYPFSQPKVSDVAMWEDLYTIADKYDTGVVMELLREALITQFLEKSPFRVYALASRWGLEGEADIASKRTLAFDILQEFPQEDAALMGGVACKKLYQLHVQCRDQARAWASSSRDPFKFKFKNCDCTPFDFNSASQTLKERLFAKPWLPAEELYEELVGLERLAICSRKGGCRNSFSFGGVRGVVSSILRDLHHIPDTDIEI